MCILCAAKDIIVVMTTNNQIVSLWLLLKQLIKHFKYDVFAIGNDPENKETIIWEKKG